ncbi:MAG: site-specific integrase [Gammaproteobacteria bacterium]|nr:site-specific integrase [Gammaproteobacteria bacterium]
MIHGLWDSPPADAPEIVRQAHRLMLQTLTRITERTPEVLTDPANAGGDRVMRAAIAALANPKIDHALRIAALTQLQTRMREVDPATPKRLFLNPAENRSTIARTVGADLVALEAFDLALERHILDFRPGSSLRSAPPEPDANFARESLGRLLALLVVRLGQGATALLGEMAHALSAGAKPAIARHWAWLDITLSAGGRAQLRRVLLDPATLAAWLIAKDHAAALPRPAPNAKAGRRNAFYRSLARSSFMAFQQTMILEQDPAWMASLDQLCTSAVQRLQLVTMPLLASYARGDVASSSLEPGTWARLIGCRPLAATESPAPETVSDYTQDAGLSGIDPGGDQDLQEQLTAGELDERGLIVELRRVMDGPRGTWGAGLGAIVDRLRSEGTESESAFLIVSWLQYLAFQRSNKGRMLADGSVRHYRGLIVNRLLVQLPPSLSLVDADALEDAYVEVIQSRRSAEQTGRIMAALLSFDRYVRTHHLPSLPKVELPGFSSADYRISSRIIIGSEYLQGLRMIADRSIVLPDDVARHRLIAYWGLAFRTGMRRSEMLGLAVSDIDERRITIRRNVHRGLKTGNARRVLPIDALDAEVLNAIQELGRDKAPEAALFFDQPPTRTDFESAAVIGHAKLLLKRVTGDANLHAHNLRHSAATLHLIGVLGNELRLRFHPSREPWMEAAVRQAERVDAAISGELHRRAARGNALSMMLGHGSELTTYEHYCHGFDLLLYIACWGGCFDPKARKPARYLHPMRQETAQLLALLGYAPTTRIETNNAPELLLRIANLRPGNIAILASPPNLTDAVLPSSSTHATSPPLLRSLNDLIAANPAISRGHPRLQSERDSAARLLAKLQDAYRMHPNILHQLIADWLKARTGDSDWAAMRPDDARQWVAQLRELLPECPIDAWHQEKAADRTTIKTAICRITNVSELKGAKGTWFVRIADDREKLNRRQKKSKATRSRSQATITWVLLNHNRSYPPRK